MAKSNFWKISFDHAITLMLVALIVASFAISALSYNTLPDEMITHWNSQGMPDGTSNKIVALFLFPILIGLFTTFYLLIPNIDPLKKNIEKFEKQFGFFAILISAFFIVIQGMVISWNKGIQISPNIIMPIAIGILLFYIGIMLKHAKRNFFIGIKTPWTLSSDYVWEKTHKLGSILFRLSGIICVISIMLSEKSIWFVLSSVIISTIIAFIYSYKIYQKEEKKKKKTTKVIKKKPKKSSSKKKK